MQAQFPPFDLKRLLTTVFAPKGGEKICILLDFPEPEKQIFRLSFLAEPVYKMQQLAHNYFYDALTTGVAKELGLGVVSLFAYKETTGSNLDLPDEAYDAEGAKFSLTKDIYPNFDIILCITKFSATAPLTAFAKKFGFRGATLHGLNPIILESGLAVDYDEVSKTAEKMRLGMTKADWIEIDFLLQDKKETLKLELGKQEAQKSHGLCRTGPDVANLPAGEIYYVPRDANGKFPMCFEEDNTHAWLSVKNGRIVSADFVSGSRKTMDDFMATIKEDPAAGEIGELGFGTQELPVSGADIQDEKILGTLHVATGRSDHLGGHLTPDKFNYAKNASHNDILFAPHKTPAVDVSEVRMMRSGKVEILIRQFKPAAYLNNLRLN